MDQSRKMMRILMAVGILLATAYIFTRMYKRREIVEHSRDQVRHTHKVKQGISTLAARIRDLELGQRGYLITRDSDFLDPYWAAVGKPSQSGHPLSPESTSLLEEVHNLENLIADNPDQKENLQSLRGLVTAKLRFTDSTLRLMSEEGDAAAIQAIQSRQGKHLMDQIRHVIDAMVQHEDSLLRERQQAEEAQLAGNGRRLYAMVGFLYILSMLALWLASRSSDRRRRAEQAVKESHELLTAVIDGTDYAIFAGDAKGILRVFSRGAERMLGYKASEDIGQPIGESARKAMLPEEIAERARKIELQYGRKPTEMEIFTLPLDSDGPFGQEWTYVRRDGSRIAVAQSVSRLPDGGSVAIVRDITQIKALERMKNEFVSTVSHELRTPLTSIRGALGLVAGGATGPLPEKAAELISIAHRNSERLVRIINDILDVEKIESGKLSMTLEPVEAVPLMHQAIETHRSYGEKYGIRFVLKQLPEEARIMADSDRLMQVLANLMSNAAKFSPQGSEVWLGAKVLSATVRFTVRDFGAGIPEAFRGRVFEKFAQAENTDARRYDGTGLGLNITKRLVEAMNGTISFETAEGLGTTFTFELPRAYPAPSAVEPTLPCGAGDGSCRVLICEDDRDVATLLKIMLERSGFAADTAHTLADARALLEKNTYAAFTLDLALPDGSGVDLLREIRSDERWQDLPVIVVSARAEEGRLELNGDAVGMIDWMVKPIDEGLLVRSLRRAVSGTESGARPRVLHVEDDADLSHILGRALQESAEWVGASTVREAEELLSTQRFDLVVLDLELPDGSGLRLLERLNGLKGRPIPVLILSASETGEDVRRRVEAVLVKSRMSEDRIVETILTLIRRHNSSGTGEQRT